MSDKNNGQRELGEIFGDIMENFSQSASDIYKSIYPEITDAQAGHLTPTLMTGIGNPSSTMVKLVNSLPGRQDSMFMVKYYSGVPKTYSAKMDPWEKDSLSYEFLREAGVTNIPNQHWPAGKRMIYMQWVDGKPLKELLRSAPDANMQESLLMETIKPLTMFQYLATRASSLRSNAKYSKILSTRDEKEKAAENIEILTGQADEEAIRAWQLLSRAHEGKGVGHGDPGSSNILLLSDKRVVLLDQELEESDGFNDAGSVLAYASMDMPVIKEVRDRYGLHFKKSKLETAVELGGGEATVELTNPAKIKEALYRTYANEARKCIKFLAKNIKSSKYSDQEEELLREQLSMIFGEFITNPEKFGLSAEDVNASKILLNRSYEIPKLKKNYKGPTVVVSDTPAGCHD